MNEYFGNVRREIEPLLPAAATRIVDVGCGIGATAAWLKTRYPLALTLGLEGQADLLETLSRNVDEAHIVDLNQPLPDLGRPDLVLLLDVLEHLVQPDRVLRAVVETLAPGGTVIVSLPNVAHLSVSLPLLLKGRFDYADAGILDRTHLRFYVRDSAVRLLNDAGLTVKEGLVSGFEGPKARLADQLTAGLLRDRLTKQYVMAARADGERQGPITWRKGKSLALMS